mmetsp:Transcript_41555/g.88672  ORF Transcript_41555/g.88672 Transcript_41555/m.88672 type:complete len:90 (+) Transcript_41555:583-852(+)
MRATTSKRVYLHNDEGCKGKYATNKAKQLVLAEPIAVATKARLLSVVAAALTKASNGGCEREKEAKSGNTKCTVERVVKVGVASRKQSV